MKRPVLFDLDGTLVDTPAANASLIADVVAEAGHPRPTDAAARAMVGKPLDVLFSHFLGTPAEHPDVQQAKTRFRKRFTERVIPRAGALVYPGVIALLHVLRQQRRPLAVVTSKVTASAEQMLRAAKLFDAFDTVVCHDMAARGKPYADLALLAAEQLGTPPADCVVVGDAVDDIRMALAARMVPVGVGYGAATPDQLSAAGAVVVAPSATALSSVLDGLPGLTTSVRTVPPPSGDAGHPDALSPTAR